MLTQNGSVGRVDYLRVMCRTAPGYAQQWETRMMDLVPEEYRVDAATFRKHGKIAPIYDGKARRATKCFEVWGEVAGMVFAVLRTSEYENITRLDWRHEIPTPPIDIMPLLAEVNKVKTNARRTKKFIDSPIRTKEDGRDAGGVSVIVGAKGSKRRLAIYKRSNAPWALEVQFGDGQPQVMLKMARDAAEAGERHKDVYMNMITIMVQQYHDAVLEMTGHTYAEFAHLEWWHQQEELLAGQEQLLHQADELWNRLDPEAQHAFIVANISPNGRYGVPIEMHECPTDDNGGIDYTDEEMLASEEWSRTAEQKELDDRVYAEE